jgi:HTH-type transcriptional regulator/antitoxin HigA
MEISPIRNEEDYQTALKEIEGLFEAKPSTPEGDRLEILVILVEAYEAKHYPIPEPEDPVQVIEYYMESRGLNRSDLTAYLGSKERVSEFFSHKRGLSLEMIRKLHEGLGIPADLLIGNKNNRKAAPHKSQANFASL